MDKSNGYENIAASFISSRKQAIGASAVRYWAKTLSPKATVLDLGCGTGIPVSKVLMDEGMLVYGIDASPTLVQTFQLNFPNSPLTCEGVEDSLFFERQFDAFFGQVTQTLQRTFGTDHFDFLINNAGTGLNAPIAEVKEEQFDQLVNVHLKCVYFLTQKALPLLNDSGRVINMSSGLTRYSFAGQSAYASMKGALEVFTRYLALELGARGITANVVAPGGIETDFGGGSCVILWCRPTPLAPRHWVGWASPMTWAG